MRTSTQTRVMTLIGLVVVFAALMMLAPISAPPPVVAQQTPGTTAPDDPADEDSSSIMSSVSLREFVSRGGPIGYTILFLLVVAFFFWLDQLRSHLLEKVRGGDLYVKPLRGLSLIEAEERIRRHMRSQAGQLMSDIRQVYNHTKDFRMVKVEADFFRERIEQRFSAFDNRMAFLADTAGGLGLLGTVWGIYLTFNVEGLTLEKTVVLRNMGVALVTTFLGIVVSVIINFMATEMSNSKGKRMLATLENVDAYQEQLLKIERGATPSPTTAGGEGDVG